MQQFITVDDATSDLSVQRINVAHIVSYMVSGEGTKLSMVSGSEIYAKQKIGVVDDGWERLEVEACVGELPLVMLKRCPGLV